MNISGIGYAQTYNYNADAKKTAALGSRVTMPEDLGQTAADRLNTGHKEEAESANTIKTGAEIRKLMLEKPGASEEELEKTLEGSLAIPKKGMGAPYSHMADETGTIEYNGVIFVCDNEKRELCLGDMSNSDNVINIPLSEGGCLRVNRDCIGALSSAIGMFSPEDVNRILRALKLDAKIREMKKEIEEMGDGVCKSNAEQNAHNAKEAMDEAKREGRADGFAGYEGAGTEEDGAFKLKDW